ncbi:cobalamin biosynthesis protein [Sneathiella aquimaris]|uniref:cobalamin biosynthesis protein n=1 Tax=Sneathiella aquimaris TaxID=2599305 RepID=UPI00146D5FEA|nr:cobalamin biosynthesis protein [Sneathiella aquimaris]
MKAFLGIGFRSDATLASFEDVYEKVNSGFHICGVATLSGKEKTPAFIQFISEMDVPVSVHSRESLGRFKTPSVTVKSVEIYGVSSVAEASALAAAGPSSRLCGKRQVSDDGMATAAIAMQRKTVGEV